MAEQRERLELKQIECEQVREQASAQESALREVRERAQHAQRELQEAHFFAKTCAEKLVDLGANIEQNTANLQEQESALLASQQELANLTDGDAQVQLQGVLERRQVQEQALAEARNTLEHATLNLNQLEQSRLSCEQKLNPLREKVSEFTLKEQEARLQFEQWSEQLQNIEEEPLLPLLEKMKNKKVKSEFLLAARSKGRLLFVNELKKVADELYITTDDGSFGFKGFTTAVLENELKNKKIDFIYACGPEVMMKKVMELGLKHSIQGELSLERFMACGYGICAQCMVDDRLVCKDGPVFSRDDLEHFDDLGRTKLDACGRKVPV